MAIRFPSASSLMDDQFASALVASQVWVIEAWFPFRDMDCCFVAVAVAVA